jgi:23S rRNA (uridine2552-2'-O)-methyltransferase
VTKKRSASGDAAGGRGLSVRVKSARGRKSSSTQWLRRQLNDPYVRQAQAAGYRSRAAFKLIELDDRFEFLKKGARVIDLGAAPGGWTQVALKRIGDKGEVVALDIQEWDEVPGATCLHFDFMDADAPDRLKEALGGKADIVLSDMAAPTTGHNRTDHLRIIGLAETAWAFAEDVLAPGGAFVCKVFQGGTEAELLRVMRAKCAKVTHAKPPASRKGSAEMYVVATGFKG